MRVRVPWVLRLLWDPVAALDLEDEEGRPDHSKILPALCLIWLLILVSRGKAPGWLIMVILISASYGYASWRTFLKSRTATRTEAATETVVHTITETLNRDERAGVQPTP